MPRKLMPMVLQPLDDMAEQLFLNFEEDLVWLEEEALVQKDGALAVKRLAKPRSDNESVLQEARQRVTTAVTEMQQLGRHEQFPKDYALAGAPGGFGQTVEQVAIWIGCDLMNAASRNRLLGFLDRIGDQERPRMGPRESDSVHLNLLLVAAQANHPRNEIRVILDELASKLSNLELRSRALVMTDQGDVRPVTLNSQEIAEASVLLLQAVYLSKNYEQALGHNPLLTTLQSQECKPFASAGVKVLGFPVPEVIRYLSWSGLADILAQGLTKRDTQDDVLPKLTWPNIAQSDDLLEGKKPAFRFSVSPLQTPDEMRRGLLQARSEFETGVETYVESLPRDLGRRRQELVKQVADKVNQNTEIIRKEESRRIQDQNVVGFVPYVVSLFEDLKASFRSPDDEVPQPWAHMPKIRPGESMDPEYKEILDRVCGRIEALINALPSSWAATLYLGVFLIFFQYLWRDPLALVIGAERASTWIWIIWILFPLLLVGIHWLPSFYHLRQAVGPNGPLQKELKDYVAAREGEHHDNVRALVQHYQIKAPVWFAWRMQVRQDRAVKMEHALQATHQVATLEKQNWAKTLGIPESNDTSTAFLPSENNIPDPDKRLRNEYGSRRFTLMVKPLSWPDALAQVREDPIALSMHVRATQECLPAWEQGPDAFIRLIRERIDKFYIARVRRHDFMRDLDRAELSDKVRKMLFELDWMLPVVPDRAALTPHYVSASEDKVSLLRPTLERNAGQVEYRELMCPNRIYVWRVLYDLAGDGIRL